MRVKIEQEVKCCAECPAHFTVNDMGAILSNCRLKGKGYDGILEDINSFNEYHIISKYCPIKNK